MLGVDERRGGLDEVVVDGIVKLGVELFDFAEDVSAKRSVVGSGFDDVEWFLFA